MATQVKYNNSTIADFTSDTKTLQCAGKVMASNVEIVDTGGGGESSGLKSFGAIMDGFGRQSDTYAKFGSSPSFRSDYDFRAYTYSDGTPGFDFPFHVFDFTQDCYLWGYGARIDGTYHSFGYSTWENPTKFNNMSELILLAHADCCFTADTLILMSDNTYKKIVDVVIGDYVKCYNEETDCVENGIIERTIIHENTTDMARINFVDKTSIEFNAYHPMMTQEGWKSLTGYHEFPVLTKEDTLLSSDNTFVPIKSIERWISEPIITYNLDVEENDNFFVSRGGVSVLAKNIC